MKIPPIFGFGNFKLRKSNLQNKLNRIILDKTIPTDTVSFTSKARYYKKYLTLPDEIKKILTPQDAVDMFQDMENLCKGLVKRKRVGIGDGSEIFENPWLKDYYSIFLIDHSNDKQKIYSRKIFSNSIWQDRDDGGIQIVKALA